MNQTLQNKINKLKALAEKSPSSHDIVAKSPARIVNDNLSRAIRNERDAEIFRKELKNAFQLAKK